MPNPRTVIDTVAVRFSDNEILQRVAERLDDGSMAWKVDIIGGLSVTVGDIEIGAVNILNAADAQINPATEETLVKILGALGGLSGPVLTTIARDVNGNVSVITEFDGTKTKTSTITRDADENVLSIAEVLT